MVLSLYLCYGIFLGVLMSKGTYRPDSFKTNFDNLTTWEKAKRFVLMMSCFVPTGLILLLKYNLTYKSIYLNFFLEYDFGGFILGFCLTYLLPIV